QRVRGGVGRARRAPAHRSGRRAAPARADSARARGAERGGGGRGDRRGARDRARRGEPASTDARGAAGALHRGRELRGAARGVGEVRRRAREGLMAAAALVRELYEAYQRRDWSGAAGLLHADATLDMPATRERLSGREEVIGFQRDYPEPWGD